MGIRSRNCDRPPKNWGPGIIQLTFNFFLSGTYPTGTTHALYTGIYCPFDFDLYGWGYGLNTVSGGTSPSVDIGIQLSKANIGSASFSADLTATSLTGTNPTGFTNLNTTPTRRTRPAAGTAWVVANMTLTTGAGAITAFPGAVAYMWIMPVEGGLSALS